MSAPSESPQESPRETAKEKRQWTQDRKLFEHIIHTISVHMCIDNSTNTCQFSMRRTSAVTNCIQFHFAILNTQWCADTLYVLNATNIYGLCVLFVYFWNNICFALKHAYISKIVRIINKYNTSNTNTHNSITNNKTVYFYLNFLKTEKYKLIS